MPQPRITLLSSREILQIHDASLKILREVGIRVHNDPVRNRLVDTGARISAAKNILYLDEKMVMEALEDAGKQYVLHGRNPEKQARFGYGEQNLISSPGQFGWFDHPSSKRRDPVLADAQAAALVGDAMENISIVGGMAVPVDEPRGVRDVVLTAELVKRTDKPVRSFPISPRSTYYVLEILSAIAGGKEALRTRPMTEMLLEPISPLRLPDVELDIVKEFLSYGQPVCVGPMAMVTATAPGTLAGTLAQENAEILAGIVTVQALMPGVPVLYGGIPHVMDPRTSVCSFGAPEQGLMALGMAELGKHYGFPVYINVNLTDAKRLDVQAGLEKMGSLLMGMLAGADLFGHAGIVGADHGGSLAWLVVDNEAAGFARRILRGFEVDEERIGIPTISTVGAGGNYLAQPHTKKYFRQDLWLPGLIWTREPYDSWLDAGSATVEERAVAMVDRILDTHTPPPLDANLEREIDRIVAASKKELGGKQA